MTVSSTNLRGEGRHGSSRPQLTGEAVQSLPPLCARPGSDRQPECSIIKLDVAGRKHVSRYSSRSGSGVGTCFLRVARHADGAERRSRGWIGGLPEAYDETEIPTPFANKNGSFGS
jgi:hypothetical protein